MKIEKTHFRTALLAFFLLLLSGTKGYANMQLNPEYRAHIDSTLNMSFLTCGPGDEAYSLYGHTALHVIDRSKDLDVAVNWGIFDFNAPNFVARFVFGLTDYLIGIYPFESFLREYREDGRWVKEQQLNLTAEEKLRIMDAIDVNYRPENRVYRYNYFYDNCTTRARDMIVDHLDGKVVYEGTTDEGPTFRELVHQYCAHQPWARFGNDMLLGVQADFKTTTKERQFLPCETMNDLNRAVIDGKRHLVSGTTTLVDIPTNPGESNFPLSPHDCALILLGFVIAFTISEIMTRKDCRWLDAILMLLCGLSGIILFLMLFSQHPTVRINFQLLLLNPLPLFFIWPMLRKKCSWQYKMWIVLICLFFICSVWQSYAEGMLIVASSLLIRNIKRLKSEK